MSGEGSWMIVGGRGRGGRKVLYGEERISNGRRRRRRKKDEEKRQEGRGREQRERKRKTHKRRIIPPQSFKLRLENAPRTLHTPVATKSGEESAKEGGVFLLAELMLRDRSIGQVGEIGNPGDQHQKTRR